MFLSRRWGYYLEILNDGVFPTTKVKRIATQFRIITGIPPAFGLGSLTFGHDFDFENRTDYVVI